MARPFTQTDTAASRGEIAAGTGLSAAANVASVEMSTGATAGASTSTFGSNDDLSVTRGFHIESKDGEPNQSNWQSGTWTIRLNISTSNVDLIIDEVYVVYINDIATDTYTTLGSQTGLGDQSDQDNGFGHPVHTYSFSCSGEAGASVEDDIYIIIGIIQASGAHGTDSITVDNDQDIDSPLDALPAGMDGTIAYHVRRMSTLRNMVM